jgi:hypothetical protein
VLVEIARNTGAWIRDIAVGVGLTERTVQAIIARPGNCPADQAITIQAGTGAGPEPESRTEAVLDTVRRPRPAQGKEDMLRVQVHDADPPSRNGQARTAGLDGQDIPGGGADGGWPHRPGNGLWLVRKVADQMIV